MNISDKEAVISSNNLTIAEKAKQAYDAGCENGRAERDLLIYHNSSVSYGKAEFPEPCDVVVHLKRCGGIAFRDAKNLRSIKVIVDEPFGMNGAHAMRDSSVEIIDFTECPIKLNDCIYTFYYSKQLKSILGELDFSNVSATTGGFSGCTALEDISFVSGSIKVSIDFGSSNKLTEASRTSIINGLADLTGGTAQSLTFHSTILSQVTDEQYALIISKNWNLR